MAYIDKEKSKLIRQELKRVFPKKHGWKFSVSIDNHSTLNICILEAPFRFSENDYMPINHYHLNNYDNNKYLQKIRDIANCTFLNSNEQNYNNSDIMTDYFDVGWYIHITQGKYDKPFKQTIGVLQFLESL